MCLEDELHMWKAMKTAYTNTMLLVYRVNYRPISEIERS